MQPETLVARCRDYTVASRRRAVERVILAMREHLDEPLSLRDMADIAYASPFHFNRFFHQVTGLPPTKFLYAMRLEAAKRLLLTTPLSVTDVCFEVGYNSLGTFTTRFKQLVGVTPSRLRRFRERGVPENFEALCARLVDACCGESSRPRVHGSVDSPVPLKGQIFVGLFPLYIPQCRPVAGTLLGGSGDFNIFDAPDGRYHLFAAAFPESKDPLSYLLPDSRTTLVGAGQRPVVVRHGAAAEDTDVTLRPLRVTDPPLLISLPNLILESFLADGQRRNSYPAGALVKPSGGAAPQVNAQAAAAYSANL